MAVNRIMYARKLEELLNQGIPRNEAIKRAEKYADVSRVRNMAEYEKYTEKARRMGAKGRGIASESEYAEIQRRLKAKKRLARAIAKKRTVYPLIDYAREYGMPRSVVETEGLTEEEKRRFGVK